jgi:hypothetical protein
MGLIQKPQNEDKNVSLQFIVKVYGSPDKTSDIGGRGSDWTDGQTWKNTQTCLPCLCTFFQICENFFILPSISFVKTRKRLVQEKYIEFPLF